MSRIGVKPIEIPEGVDVTLNGNTVTVTGPKGELTRNIHPDMIVSQDEGQLTVQRPNNKTRYRELHGSTRSLIANMVQGVHSGFEKALEVTGVGYRAQMQNDKLVVTAGFSHPIEFEPTEGVEIEVPQNTRIIVRGIDKELVGAVAANIRAIRPPDPYKGKGIRYEGEELTLKVGKMAK